MHMSVGARLLSGLVAIIILMAAVGSLAIYNLTRISDLNADIYNREFLGLNSAQGARVAAERLQAQTLLAIVAPKGEAQDLELAHRQEALNAFNGELATLRSLLYSPQTRDLLQQVDTIWARYLPIQNQAIEAAVAGDRTKAETIMIAADHDNYAAVDSLLQQLATEKGKVAKAAVGTVSHTATLGRNLTIGSLFIAIVLALIITLWLRQIADVIRSGTQSLAATTSELLASVTQQEASTTEQAAAVSQTTATIDQVRVTAQQASEKARMVAVMAQEAAQIGAEGLQTVEISVAGMQEVRSRVESIAEQILALSAQTQQVGEIITAVDDIADQSNMLAVNAAIEAARAGEQGRGFAVVAQEVRNLAERSKAATVQVRSILTDIQRATNAAVLATEQGTKGAEDGAKQVDKAGQAIHELAQRIQHAAEAGQQILASSGQQGVGMDQIAAAMSNINQTVTETAAGTRQLQKAAQDMDGLAKRMSILVARSPSASRNGHL